MFYYFMDHQDWENVTITKQVTNKKKEVAKHVSQRAENTEVKLIPSSEFKKTMMQARVVKKLTQQDLARNMNIPIGVIRDSHAET